MSIQPTQPDQSNRLLAALAYPIWPIALIIVLTDMKKDAFMKTHGWTGLFWSIAWLVIWFALRILVAIPVIGVIFAILGGMVLWLVWLVLSIYYAMQAYNGKAFTIPFVSDFAKKYGA